LKISSCVVRRISCANVFGLGSRQNLSG